MAIVLVVSLYTSRVVLQQLGASDFGTFNVVGGIITMLSFLTGTLSQGVQRFFNFYKGRQDYDSINKFFYASIVILLVLGVIIILLGETIGLWFLNAKMNIPSDRMYAANWVYQLSILSMLAALLSVPFSAMIVAHEDFGIYAFLSIGVAMCNLLVAFLLKAASSDKLIFYAILVCIVHLMNAAALVIISLVKYRKIRPVAHRDHSVFKSLLSFSGWTVLGGMSFTAGTTGLNIILNIFFGTIANAARGIAVQVSTKVDEFIHNIQQAMNPQITQLYAKGEYEAVESLVDDNFRWNFALYWLIALPLLFEVEYILQIWLGEVPQYTSVFTSIVVIRSLLKCFERPINTLNFAIGIMKYVNLFAFFSVSLMVVVVILAFKFGFPPYWAFIFDCITIFFCTLFYMYQARKHGMFSFSHFIKNVLIRVMLVILISVSGTWLLRHIDLRGFLRLIYTLGVTFLLSGITIYYILFTSKDRSKVNSFIFNNIHRIVR